MKAWVFVGLKPIILDIFMSGNYCCSFHTNPHFFRVLMGRFIVSIAQRTVLDIHARGRSEMKGCAPTASSFRYVLGAKAFYRNSPQALH